jgi:tetratricopeptide (TPR) repeat protein
MVLLTQSRGWLYTLPLVLLLFFLVAPGRVRNALAATGVGVAVVVVALRPVLDVFQGAADGVPSAELVGGAVRAILLAAGVLVVVGLLAALLDRGVALAERPARRVSLASGAALALATVAAVVIALGSLDDPVGRARAAFEEFRTGAAAGELPAGSTRFSAPAAGQNRFDFWRVAFTEFQDRPLLGIGADNFEDAYAQEGESLETPRFPHSLELRIISQTGLVGAILFLGAIAAALAAGAMATLRASRLGAAAAGAAIAAFLYWAVHGSVDWFFELPALGAPAFAMLGLSASLAPRAAHHIREGEPAPIGGRRARAALVAVGTVAALAVLGLPWVAQRQVDRAIAIWPAAPDAAFARLDSAAALNPLSSEPHTTAAAIALRLDRPEAAAAGFEAALERDPLSAYSNLQLGAIASQEGRPAEARALVARAAELAPRDEVIARAESDLRRGRRLDPGAIYDQQLARRGELVGD